MARPRTINRQTVTEPATNDEIETEMENPIPDEIESAEEALVAPEEAPAEDSPEEAPEETPKDADDTLDGAPNGVIVEDRVDAKKHVENGNYTDDIFLKMYPYNSKRPTYILMGVKGARAAV